MIFIYFGDENTINVEARADMQHCPGAPLPLLELLCVKLRRFQVIQGQIHRQKKRTTCPFPHEVPEKLIRCSFPIITESSSTIHKLSGEILARRLPMRECQSK